MLYKIILKGPNLIARPVKIINKKCVFKCDLAVWL